MASNPAEITSVEHEGNMVQFNMCAPVNGKISGEAARTVLMKSGLPPPVLGQIWSLSDLDRDGHLDQREFSIAMKLTRNCLAGLPLPPALPPSLLNVPLSGSAPRAPAPLPTMPPMMMGGMGMGMMTGAPPMMAPPVRPMGGPPMPGAYPLTGMAMGTPPGGGGTVFPHYATGPRGSISSMGGSMGGSPAKAAPPLPGRPPGVGGATFPGKQLENWTMPQQNKLKYAQQFNGVDKQRAGFLNGPAARNALGQSGLPTHALAHVWTLADVNKDGRLSVEEFSIAMWLIDQHKTGFALPAELPPELAAMTHHGTARSDSPATPSGEAPAQKVSTPKTFEDKRKDNYDRGQAELDRRRQQLQEEEDRRKAEIVKREREAEEKRERERQEQERRREAERQAELERQRQMEEERLEQERKRAAERDRIRLEKEKEMKKVMLEKRKRELMAQKSAAAEKTATAEQKKKTLQFQLQALTEKHTDLEGEVGKARQGIENITKEIEGMRAIRDEKLAAIAEAQKENQAAAVQAEQLAHQLLQLQGANREATDRAQGLDELISRRAAAKQRVEELKRQIDATRERNVQQRGNVVTKEEELATGLRPQVEKLRVEHAAGIARATEKQKELHGRLQRAAAANHAATAAAAAPSAMYDAPPGDISSQQQSMQQSWHQSPAKDSPISAAPPSSLYDTPPVVPDSSFSNGHHDTSSNGPLPSSSAATVKYRSIYAFESRSTDELSFQPGDVILVFEGHAAEPGWLAGQIKEKVGWFPAAFAEPIAPVNTNVTSPMQTVPTNVTPSPSLEKILEEPNASSPPSMTSLQSPTRNGHTMVEGVTAGDEPVLCVCAAQFPWKARNTGDLSFGKGDQIEVLEKTDMKWRGRKTVDGTIGWFPKSYVKVTDETPRGSSAGSRQASVVSGGGASSSATPTSGSAHSFPATSASSQSINSVIAVVPGGGGGGGAVGGAGSTAGTPMSSAGEWYVANYDFDAAEPTDLPLRAGDRILVLEKNDDWWKGSANGREGIFPANYVVALEGATHAAAAIAHAQAAAAAAPATPLQKAKVIAAFQAAGENQLSLAMDDVIFVRSKSDAGWWEGELRDAAGGVKIGWFPGDYVQLEPSSSSVSSPIGHTFVAMFDYVASQGDELSFKTGDSITVTAQTDAEWWTGHLVGTSPATAGLFPSNYVQPSPPIPSPRRIDHTVSSSLYDAPPPEVVSPTEKKKEDRLANLVKELIETELRYHADLCLIRDLFYRSLQSVLDIATLNAIFINLPELIELSDILSKRLRNESPGTVFSAEIDRLAAFVTFCSQQTAALQTLETVLQRPEVRRVYTVCCQAERARGLSLSYFLLLPLGRVTRYPLLFDKMFSSSHRASQLHSSIDVAMQLLKSLVSEVNVSIRERDNLQMLCWSQQHVKMEGLREKIEFTSNTRSQGAREFLHSGVLYKAHSGRMLVAILYNDFLLLTTPDEHIEADGFRVSASTEVSLSLYKTPLLLGKLEVVPISKEKDDDVSFSLKLGEDLIHLRAPNRNARTLWLRQLEEAVSNALIALAEIARKATVVTDDNPAGRLMVEVMELRDVDARMAENSLVFRVALGKDKAQFETQQQPDLTQLRFTTQFAFASTQQPLRLEISRKRFFSPDSPIYDDVSLPLTSIVADCAQHRGPQLKMITLKPLYTHAKERKDALKLKLVVQMFDL